MSTSTSPLRAWLAGLLLGNTSQARQRTSGAARPLRADLPPLPAAVAATPAYTQMPRGLRDAPLVFADAQNMSYSLRKHGFDCDFNQVLRVIRRAAPYAQAHAFARLRSRAAVDFARDYFRQAGWVPHVTFGQSHRLNADVDVLIASIELLARQQPEDVLLCTGDGDLGCCLAQHIREHFPTTRVHILSVAGSTSGRLSARTNPHVHSNTLLGRDCIGPAR